MCANGAVMLPHKDEDAIQLEVVKISARPLFSQLILFKFEIHSLSQRHD